MSRLTPQSYSLLRFEAFRVALELVRMTAELWPRLRQKNKKLAEQGESAVDSVAANLAEGRRRLGRDRRHLFSIAAGSAQEAQAHLLMAEAKGLVEMKELEAALGHTERLLAMTWKLTR